MTTEEKVSLFSKRQGAKIAEDIEIEQLESLQQPQLTVKGNIYSEQLLGSIFLKMSEEVNQQVEAFHKEIMEMNGGNEELAKKFRSPLSKGDPSLSLESFDPGFTYQAFPDARLYKLVIHIIEWVLFPGTNGITTSMGFHYGDIASIFTKGQLEGCTKEQARQECDGIAEALGFSLKEPEIYALDAESLNQMQQETGIESLGTEKDEKGNIIGEILPWTKEQEVYLILYKKSVQDKIVESVASENILFVFYHHICNVWTFDCDNHCNHSIWKQKETD